MDDKLQVMLELERRGALPADKQAILSELRRRGVLDETPRNYLQEQRDKSLVAKNIPWMDGLEGKGVPQENTQSGIVSAATTENAPSLRDNSKGWENFKQEAANIGRDQLRNLPKYGAALATAGAAAAMPEVSIPVAVGTALAGVGGYQGARSLRSGLEQILGLKPSDEGEAKELVNSINEGVLGSISANPVAMNTISDFATRTVPNAVKGTISGAANWIKEPERLASRYLNRPIASGEVSAALENQIPLTKGWGKAEETTKGLAKEAYAPAKELVTKGATRGSQVSLEEAKQAARNRVAYYEKYRPNSPQLDVALKELKTIEAYPSSMPIEEAEALKQHYNKMITDWGSAPNKDLAQKPAVSLQKAFKRELPAQIGEATANPAEYAQANQEYSDLAKLLRNRGEFSPVQTADKTADSASFRRRMFDRAQELVNRQIVKGRGLEQTPETIDFANISRPQKDIEWTKALRGTYSDIPKVEEPIIEEAAPFSTIQPDFTIEDVLRMQNEPQGKAMWDLAPPEATPGTLLEGEVPRGGFKTPEGYNPVGGGIEAYPSEIQRPAQVLPEEGSFPGTLMEGLEPPKEFNIGQKLPDWEAIRSKGKGRKITDDELEALAKFIEKGSSSKKKSR